MSTKRTIRLSLLAATLLLVNVTPHAHAEQAIMHLFKRWWGNTAQTKTRSEKLKITARRVGTVAAALAGIGALGYGMWRVLCRNTTKHPLFGNLMDQGTQASMAEAEFIQPESTIQGPNECGLFASANAQGVEDLADDLRAGRPLAGNAFAEAGARHAAALRDAHVRLRQADSAQNDFVRELQGVDIPANDLPRSVNRLFPERGRMLEQQDIIRLNQDHEENGGRHIPFIFIGRNHNRAIDVVGVQGFPAGIAYYDENDNAIPIQYTHEDALRDFLRGQRNTLHFLLNYHNIHWANLSLVRRGNQQPLAVYLDSINSRPYGSESRALISFINGLLERARTQSG